MKTFTTLMPRSVRVSWRAGFPCWVGLLRQTSSPRRIIGFYVRGPRRARCWLFREYRR